MFLRVSLIALIFVMAQCSQETMLDNISVLDEPNAEMSSKGKPDPTEETVGNNLSFPVIWSDGGTKALRGTMGTVTSLNGTWWGVWGEDPIDPQAPLFSCGPYIGDVDACIDAEYKAFIQKDPNNEWQAINWDLTERINVDGIDWGDNLESIDWSLRSQVRTEVVLYENTATYNGEVIEYAMRHADSWGIDEVHGLQTELLNNDIVYGPGDIATVYTPNARFTIQKLDVENLEGIESKLKWRHKDGWTEADDYTGNDVVNDVPLFNMVINDAGDGPGFYNAEVNVKGKIIYGYTWNVRSNNEGAGYYRLTFSFDDDTTNGPALNTYFKQGETEIILPIEEEEVAGKRINPISDDDGDSGEGTRGGVAVIDFDNNLSYMDIFIIAKTTGSGGGAGGGCGAGGGSGSGGGSGHN